MMVFVFHYVVSGKVKVFGFSWRKRFLKEGGRPYPISRETLGSL